MGNQFRIGFHSASLSRQTMRDLWGVQLGVTEVAMDPGRILAYAGSMLHHPEWAGFGFGFDADGALFWGDRTGPAGPAIDLWMQCPQTDTELRTMLEWDFNQPLANDQDRGKAWTAAKIGWMLGRVSSGSFPCRLILWTILSGTDYQWAPAGYDPGYFPPLPAP